MSGVDVIRAGCLAAHPHGFLGRRGGVSGGAMSGLNTGYGSGDDRAAIAENRRRAVEAVLRPSTSLGTNGKPGSSQTQPFMPSEVEARLSALVTVHQVHSAEAVRVEQPWGEDDRPHADALVTDRPGLLLGILTADCAPVLLADSDAGVVGAAHAGWRGAIAGVTDSTVAAMERLGADRGRIAAAIGPCIGRASYEVDEQFRTTFLETDEANDRFFAAGPAGKPHFDLSAYVRHRLLAAGVGEVETLHLDTYGDEERFFSYRRSTHRGEQSYGRQISVIGLRD